MTGKAHRRKFRQKGRKGRQHPVAPAAKVSQPVQPGARPAATVRPVSAAKPAEAPIVYPYITSELRRIGILAGIMFIILVVLAFIFG